MAKKNEPEMMDGMENYAGTALPPFLTLNVGGKLGGILREVRKNIKTEKQRVKDGKKTKTIEVEKIDYFYHIELTFPAKGEDGTKKHLPVSFDAGTMITVSGCGSVDRAFHRAALQAGGENLEEMDKDRNNWPDGDYSLLKNRSVYIERQEDGEMKKGQFKGKMVKQFVVGVETKEAVPA